MIYLQLFLSFLKIGAISFGGGYGMVSVLRDEALSNGWMSEEEFLNLVATAESTPGPIAVNMATFIGSTQAGILGALVSTLGVVLPSFIIILIISAVLKNFLRYGLVQGALRGIRPVVSGLVVATGITLFLKQILSLENIGEGIAFNWKQAAIFLLIILFAFAFKKLFKKKPSPILLIIFSALSGMLFFGIIP